MKQKHHKERSYWPHMILGFLIVGITLGYWTVKSATSVPVQESDEFMMKYQQADLHFNRIMKQKANFDRRYKIKLVGASKAVLELENTKRAKEEEVVVLKKGNNSFSYDIHDHAGTVLADANVTFLLTRPHTNNDDILIENIVLKDGKYRINDVNVSKPGRYTLQLKVVVDKDTIGYSEIPAYLTADKTGINKN